VPEIVVHYDNAHYLGGVMSAHVRDGWATGDVCCYWIRGDFQRYLAPDVFLIDGPKPDPPPSKYLSWIHPPIRLALEIASRSSLRYDEGPKLQRYAEGLRPAEYLFYNPATDGLRLYRWTGAGYVEVEADARGWVWSEQARLWFGVERPGYLRAYDREAQSIRSHEEEVAYAEYEARRRADAEAEVMAEAGRRVAAEAETRAEADRRAAAEAETRAEADRRVAAEAETRAEADRRAEAERRVAELEAEVARLRAAKQSS
jgi:Uma2 family endonuclease